MSQDKLVYSSERGSTRKDKVPAKASLLASGPTKMRLETKGRGGRVVTVLWNFPWEEDEVKALMKSLQQIAACGATYKKGQIEFQGDIRPKAIEFFAKAGKKLVAAGG